MKGKEWNKMRSNFRRELKAWLEGGPHTALKSITDTLLLHVANYRDEELSSLRKELDTLSGRVEQIEKATAELHLRSTGQRI